MNNRFTHLTAQQIKPGDTLVCHFWPFASSPVCFVVAEGDVRSDSGAATGVLVRVPYAAYKDVQSLLEGQAVETGVWIDASWFSPGVGLGLLESFMCPKRYL